MIFRRAAFAIGLIVAAILSQLPEFTQQYRQRLGGAVDELSSAVQQFDTEATAQSIDRDQAISRLEHNGDVLAQQRGRSMADTVARRDKLQAQQRSFTDAGPVSQYAVLGERFDPGVARGAWSDFQPAFPATTAGIFAALVGFVAGWIITHLLAWPVRHRRRRVSELTV